MKTMLGGWQDVQWLQTDERAARARVAEPWGAVSLQRCVAVAPKVGSSQASTARRSSLRKTCTGGVSAPLAPPAACARQLAPPALPEWAGMRRHRGAPLQPAPGAARKPRLALDETCEIRDVDLVLLMQPRLPAAPASAAPLAGLRRGGTLLEPELRIIPVPRRGLAGLLPAILQWIKGRLPTR